MAFITLLIGLAGLGVAIFLVMDGGAELVLSTFAAAGWGIVVVTLIHFLHMLLAGRGWQVLWHPSRRPKISLFVWVLWVREAVNALLPVARIGGEVAALRIMRKSGMPLSSVVGSLMVETTLSVATTFLFVLMGLFILGWRVPEHGMFLQWGLGLLVAALCLGVLFALQKYGAFSLLSRIVNMFAKGKFEHLHMSGKKLDRAVAAFYGRPARLFSCTFWSFIAWGVGALEIWAALHFLGYNASISDAIILEAMIMATGSAAFFVPASLGVQEGTFLIFGRLLGIPDETCLALALVRRSRDILLMVPGLLIWQVQEGKSFFTRRVLKNS